MNKFREFWARLIPQKSAKQSSPSQEPFTRMKHTELALKRAKEYDQRRKVTKFLLTALSATVLVSIMGGLSVATSWAHEKWQEFTQAFDESQTPESNQPSSSNSASSEPDPHDSLLPPMLEAVVATTPPTPEPLRTTPIEGCYRGPGEDGPDLHLHLSFDEAVRSIRISSDQPYIRVYDEKTDSPACLVTTPDGQGVYTVTVPVGADKTLDGYSIWNDPHTQINLDRSSDPDIHLQFAKDGAIIDVNRHDGYEDIQVINSSPPNTSK